MCNYSAVERSNVIRHMKTHMRPKKIPNNERIFHCRLCNNRQEGMGGFPLPNHRSKNIFCNSCKFF
jgi:transposase